ncbi:MAG: hypothetical protein RLZZ416_140 [Candidatus Parcubacteria bacterium]|jgi:hypothetical protein
MVIDEFETFFDTARSERLSPHERASMRERLKLFVHEHPAAMPLGARLRSRVRSLDFRLFSHIRLHPAALSLVLVLTAGIGTSYAAEGALPGDALYPLKIHFNESIQGALAVSDEAKAHWNVERTSRRLAEAEALAQQGALTSEAKTDIELGFDTSNGEFDENVRALASATGSAPVVAAAAERLEASLKEHEDALSKMSDAAPQNKSALESIRERVRERVQKVGRVRTVASNFVSVSNRVKSRVEVQESGADTATLRAAQAAPAAMSAVSVESATSSAASDVGSAAGLSEASEEVSVPAEVFEAAIKEAQSDDHSGGSHERSEDSRQKGRMKIELDL